MAGGKQIIIVGFVAAIAAAASWSSVARAQGAPTPSWTALVADRAAARPGDSLTVLIYQDATASNSIQNGSKRSTRASGQVGLDDSGHAAKLDLSSGYDGGGQTVRSGRMVAQIGVVVTEALPNGDLRVAGEQSLNLNGERTHIRVRGRVRPADISSANTVLSARLADSAIEYSGSGFVSRSSRPGLLSRVLGGLGVF